MTIPDRFLPLCLAFALLAVPACQTSTPIAAQPEQVASKASNPAPGKYITPADLDFRSLLPDPPAPGSPISQGEIEIVLAAQADASPQSRARAEAEEDMKFWLFADVLGPSFNAEQMPKTAALIKQIERDSKAISDEAKKIWKRPRPFVQDSRIALNSKKPGENSYPSGHATRGTAWTETLCILAPDKAEVIQARGRLIGFDRLILGVHFPSDVAAGNALGKAIVEKMKQSPAFQQDLEAARAEWVR